QFKGHIIAEYALKADRPVVFCDVDLIWNNDGALWVFNDERPPVTLLARDDMPCMRYNAGVIFSRGSGSFWLVYQSAIGNLPDAVRGWWGDQFALLVACERLPRTQ